MLPPAWTTSKTTVVKRRQKDGSLKDVISPVMSADCNDYMGFLDNFDHLLSSYKIDRKSKKWWHRIFCNFLDLAIVNSFIIYVVAFLSNQPFHEKTSLFMKRRLFVE